MDKKIASSKDIKYAEMKAGKAIRSDYYGDYMKMDAAYGTIKDWMKTHNKIAAGDPWEVYMTDPMSEKDTAKWLTQIYYPL